LSPVRWLTLSSLWRDRLHDALQTNAGERELDQGFIDRLQARRSFIEVSYWKLAITQTVLLAALFLNAVVLPAEFSIAGLSAKQVGAMKEIILFVSATIAIVVAFLSVQRHALKTVSAVWAKKKYSPEVFEFADLLFGDAFMQLPNIMVSPGRSRLPTAFLNLIYLLFVVLIVSWVICYILANLVLYAVIVVDVATAPSLPAFWSTAIVVYAAIAYSINLVLSILLWAPMPYRDYSLVTELAELRKRSKEDYEQRLKELATHSK